MFGQRTHVIGRTCEVDINVNSTSVPTGNQLLEHFEFSFMGEITVTENCPSNGTIISQNWTFNNTATILLPLVCSLNSSVINCNSVALHSRQTKVVHLEQHRMKVIVPEKFEETKTRMNASSFISNPSPVEIFTNTLLPSFMDSHKWIFIGAGGLIASMVILFISFKICHRNGQSDSKISINVENSANSMNTSPSCPATTMAHTGTNPSEHQIVQVEPDCPPAYQVDYTTLDVDAIIAKRPGDRSLPEQMALSRFGKSQKGRKN